MIGLWLLWLLWGLAGPVAAVSPVVEPSGVAAVGLVGVAGETVTDQAVLDARTRRIGLQIRCPVCQGLSIADSSSDAAVGMSNRITELVAEGYSDEQILDYFADRYGDFILLMPPKEGLHSIIWVAPLAVVAGALIWFLFRTGRGGSTPALTASVTPTEDDPYRARILAELDD